MSLSSNDGDVIEYLVAHGAYVEAARVCVERGDLARAVQLYERVWRFADALPLAERLGDPALAVRLALDAKLPARAVELAATVGADAPDALRAVAEAFASRGRPFEGARVLERALEWARAADLYRRAGAPLDEARAREAAGQLREAGLLYERLIAQGAEAEVAAARLALGRLLARLGRPEEAARLLQAAARHAPARTAALRALCAPLLALGLRGAAAEVLARLRARRRRRCPASPEEFVALEEAELAATSRAPRDAGGARRFRIGKLLGAGATGRVYLADDTLLGQPVALKLLTRRRGRLGARAAGLPALRARGRGGGTPAPPEHRRAARRRSRARPVRPRAHAGRHARRARRRRGSAARWRTRAASRSTCSRRWARPTSAASSTATSSPRNVFYDAAGNAKLGDFGAAHLADFGQTQTGGFFGTVAYMAPEQITGGAIGVAADLYALGRHAVPGAHGPATLPRAGPRRAAPRRGAARRPRRCAPELSRAHDDVLARALAKAPAGPLRLGRRDGGRVAAWPTEAAASVGRAPRPRPSCRSRSAAVADDVRELGVDGARAPPPRRDPRTARLVLVEQRTLPLDDAALADVRRRAAAGGPDVQRVLRALGRPPRDLVRGARRGAARRSTPPPTPERAQLEPARAALPTSRSRTSRAPRAVPSGSSRPARLTLSSSVSA